jgi:hypothetical protein
MRSGVATARLGVLDIRDVRDALGEEFHTAKTIEVLVATARGLPFAGVVALVQKPSGRGSHRALACPQCGESRFKLHVRDGKLGCEDCFRVHARRCTERTCASWNMGGREEDRLLRLVDGRSRPTSAALERARDLARELVQGDEDRAMAAMQVAGAAITAVEVSG